MGWVSTKKQYPPETAYPGLWVFNKDRAVSVRAGWVHTLEEHPVYVGRFIGFDRQPLDFEPSHWQLATFEAVPLVPDARTE